ncbi:hypothetical protein CEXT_508981 [Caerostris extrusa]|uniref:Uncharacterized protein n=1 Tax=Caerostris extrusa TaxID=172846 RepID=A0AAV4QU96_CAEEX|nr:hypothetical protein CEXT_508981 [Caerostris extrusa]
MRSVGFLYDPEKVSANTQIFYMELEKRKFGVKCSVIILGVLKFPTVRKRMDIIIPLLGGGKNGYNHPHTVGCSLFV